MHLISHVTTASGGAGKFLEGKLERVGKEVEVGG